MSTPVFEANPEIDLLDELIRLDPASFGGTDNGRRMTPARVCVPPTDELLVALMGQDDRDLLERIADASRLQITQETSDKQAATIGLVSKFFFKSRISIVMGSATEAARLRRKLASDPDLQRRLVWHHGLKWTLEWSVSVCTLAELDQLKQQQHDWILIVGDAQSARAVESREQVTDPLGDLRRYLIFRSPEPPLQQRSPAAVRQKLSASVNRKEVPK